MINKAEQTIQELAVGMGFMLQPERSKLWQQQSLHIRAIQRVQEIVEKASDPLAAANKIITAFGCTAVSDENQARIIAKGLAEQIVVQGLDYDPATAMKIVAEKYMKIERTMPWLFASSTSTQTPVTKTDISGSSTHKKVKKPKRGGDKKERALTIFNTYAGKGVADSDVAKDISKQLDITFANAYYYVTRVFQKKYSGKK